MIAVYKSQWYRVNMNQKNKDLFFAISMTIVFASTSLSYFALLPTYDTNGVSVLCSPGQVITYWFNVYHYGFAFVSGALSSVLTWMANHRLKKIGPAPTAGNTDAANKVDFLLE